MGCIRSQEMLHGFHKYLKKYCNHAVTLAYSLHQLGDSGTKLFGSGPPPAMAQFADNSGNSQFFLFIPLDLAKCHCGSPGSHAMGKV